MGMLTDSRAASRASVRRGRRSRAERRDSLSHRARDGEERASWACARRSAAARALAHFGGVQRVREEHRDVRRLQWIEDFAGRHALRAAHRCAARRRSALAAIITLALGIGANVAIFSAVNAVVLRPLPFPAARPAGDGHGGESGEALASPDVAAPANYLDWRERRPGVPGRRRRTPTFLGTSTLTGRGDPQTPVRRRYVTGNFFSMLGVAPALGRTFTDEETWMTGRTSRGAERSRAGATSSAATRRSSARRSTSTARDVPGRRRDAAGLRVPVRERRRVAVDRLGSGAARRRRLPSRALAARHRAAQAGRDADARGRAAANGRRRGSSTNIRRRTSTWARRSRRCTLPRRRHAASAAPAAHVRRVAAAHRVRERRQPAARASRRPRARGGAASRARRGPRRLVRQAIAESLVLSVLGGACGLCCWDGRARARSCDCSRRHAPRPRFRRRRTVLAYVVADHASRAACCSASRRRSGCGAEIPRIRSRTAAAGRRRAASRSGGATCSSSARSRSRCS